MVAPVLAAEDIDKVERKVAKARAGKIFSLLLFSFQFSFFLWIKLGLFLLLFFAFVFFSFISHFVSPCGIGIGTNYHIDVCNATKTCVFFQSPYRFFRPLKARYKE